MSVIDRLEQIQCDKKYNLPPEQLTKLVESFDARYAAEVMIECGHTNEEIKHYTKVNQQIISWMRVKYKAPPKRGELEFRYAELNSGFVHVQTKLEKAFCKLFRCGVYHKNHKKLI